MDSSHFSSAAALLLACVALALALDAVAADEAPGGGAWSVAAP